MKANVLRVARVMWMLQVLAGSAVASAALGASTAEEPVRPRAVLAVHLDDSVYLENQPIRALLELRIPPEASPLASMPSLSPIGRAVDLQLTRVGKGAIPRSGYWGTGARRPGGRTLPPGTSGISGINVLDWFGRFDRKRGAAGWAIGQLYLPPGEYTLAATVELSENEAAHRVVSEPRRFTIHSVEEQAREGWFVDDILNDRQNSGRSTRRERARQRLVEAVDSKYFFLVLGIAGDLPDSVRLNLMKRIMGRADQRRREPFLAELLLRLAQTDDFRRSLESLTMDRDLGGLTRRVMTDGAARVRSDKGKVE